FLHCHGPHLLRGQSRTDLDVKLNPRRPAAITPDPLVEPWSPHLRRAHDPAQRGIPMQRQRQRINELEGSGPRRPDGRLAGAGLHDPEEATDGISLITGPADGTGPVLVGLDAVKLD